MVSISISRNSAGLKQMQEAFERLVEREVLIGIPNETSGRSGDGLSNAELLYLHNSGSPANNNPARPVLKPAIEHNKGRIADAMQTVVVAALNGDNPNNKLKQVGMEGQNIARGWFTNPANGWAPNKGHSDVVNKKPLIDTGEMRKSITYAVRRVGETSR